MEARSTFHSHQLSDLARLMVLDTFILNNPKDQVEFITEEFQKRQQTETPVSENKQS